jgi:signal transduction histidine kinase/ligand-binding sensor domain-containing protein
MKNLLALPLLLSLPTLALAERLPIKVYTTADGLARDTVNKIALDSKGFLWFGTSEGLSRYDGYSFTNYGGAQGLPGRSVNDLIETRDGLYWVATDHGLCRFHPEGAAHPDGSQSRFRFDYTGEKTAGHQIGVVLEDHAGVIWCGGTGGFFRLDRVDGQWVCKRVSLGHPSTGRESHFEIRGLLEDRRGSLWITASDGLYRRRPDGRVERFTKAEGLPDHNLSSALLEDRDGRIWVGTGQGLYELVRDPQLNAPAVARVYTTKDGLIHNHVVSAYQAADGRLWITNGRFGFSVSQPDAGQGGLRFQGFDRSNGVLGGWNIAEDRNGNLWVSSEAAGVMKITDGGFTTYGESDGLMAPRITALLLTQAGDLCTVSGRLPNREFIQRFNGRGFDAVELRFPFGWGWYQVMFQARTGEWWLQAGPGLIRYPPLARLEQLTNARPQAIYTGRDGLPEGDLFRIFEDSHGDVWISNLAFADCLTRWERRTATFRRFTEQDGLPQRNAPTAFAEDASGNLWIGFYKGDLARYAAGRMKRFSSADGVPPGFIRAIYPDRAGRIWAATGEGGVVRIDDPAGERPRFAVYNTASGLSSNQATCITEDQWGRIYVGTGRGLDRLDLTDGSVKHYTTADGLAGNLINVALRDRDGALWFGTLEGLSRLVPKRERDSLAPPIRISELHAGARMHPTSALGESTVSGLVLEPDQNQMRINFSSISFGSGGALRYQYKLEGADAAWSAPGAQREVNYASLAPGSYRFLVRAITPDGVQSPSPASVEFRVLPPFWRRWWFVLLALVLTAAPILTVARYRHQRSKAVREAEEAVRKGREERLAELERVRRRIATDLHDDIGSSLTQISILSEVVRRQIGSDDSPVARPLTQIAGTSRELVDAMSDIVWAINPLEDHLSDLTQRMRRFASDGFTARNIRFDLRLPEAGRDVPLGANLRREIFLIFKESVNNMIRHSGCTEAEIELRAAADHLELWLRDNGRGFDPGHESDGHGLVSMRDRARGIGGELELRSEPGRGTTVTLRVPLDGLAPSSRRSIPT